MLISTDQYVACMRLSVGLPDGTTRWVEAGSPIEGFEDWPYIVRDSLLRLGRVKKHGLLQTANLSVKGGFLHFETPEEVAAEQAAGVSGAAPLGEDGASLPAVKRGRGRPPKAAAV